MMSPSCPLWACNIFVHHDCHTCHICHNVTAIEVIWQIVTSMMSLPCHCHTCYSCHMDSTGETMWLSVTCVHMSMRLLPRHCHTCHIVTASDSVTNCDIHGVTPLSAHLHHPVTLSLSHVILCDTCDNKIVTSMMWDSLFDFQFKHLSYWSSSLEASASSSHTVTSV